MKIKLTPDRDIRVLKTRISRVPVLILKPAKRPSIRISLLWIHGDGEPFYAETLAYVENLRAAGIEAEVDVYHTDMHAFDMLRDDDLSREATEKFERHFEYALENLQ